MPFRVFAAGLMLSVAAASLAPVSSAYADPPGGHKNKGRGNQSERGGGHGGDTNISVSFSFNDGDRVAVRDYFGGPMPGGRCPPGLAKKNNGCMPPGQAKKWMIGQPLPRDVIYYSLPPELSVRMSLPPSGYKYVRVAGDILMIAVGTGMVAAAIEDLARM
ncbi:MAG: hypothetical protein VW600_18150 [Ferrovibrio sp.]